MGKNTNVPKLRFPEFEGEWKKERLDEFAEFKAGYAFKSELMLTIKSSYQILKMSNVYQNELRLDRNPSYWEITDDKQKEFLLKKGDSILTLTGTVGKRDYGYSVMINEDNKFLLNQRLVLLREIERKSNSGFINNLLSTEKFLFYFFLEAKGGTGNQTNVSTEDVKNICLNFPILPEQTKIASFLTAVDDKLTQLKKKKSLLEEYKKGVMQKIFSQELRFKDDNGEDFPEWEEKTLGVVMIEGKLGGNYENSESNNGIPVIKMGNIGRGDINLNKIQYLPENETYNTDDVLKEGDLLFNTRNTLELVGKVAIWRNELPFAIYNSNLMRMKFNNKFESTNRFLNAMFNTKKSIKQLRSYATGTTSVAAIYGRDLVNMNISFPSLPEQTKIANFLSVIDEKINHCSKQIERMEDWKKGLLQQMFC